MADSKIYLGSIHIGSLFEGASDISIYLGEEKVYPLETPLKFQATYSGGEVHKVFCDGNTTLNTSNTHSSGYDLTAMTEAIIGDCVTTIGNSAFAGCTSLTSITANAATPPVLGSYAFDSTNDCPIYVPSQSVEAYKSASGWSDYASRIQAIP